MNCFSSIFFYIVLRKVSPTLQLWKNKPLFFWGTLMARGLSYSRCLAPVMGISTNVSFPHFLLQYMHHWTSCYVTLSLSTSSGISVCTLLWDPASLKTSSSSSFSILWNSLRSTRPVFWKLEKLTVKLPALGSWEGSSLYSFQGYSSIWIL